MSINIEGVSKAAALAALYNASRPQGMGFLQHTPEPMTEAQAAKLLEKQTYFDYLQGRVMKIDMADNNIEERLYDRDNGHGAAYAALEPLLTKHPA